MLEYQSVLAEKEALGERRACVLASTSQRHRWPTRLVHPSLSLQDLAAEDEAGDDDSDDDGSDSGASASDSGEAGEGSSDDSGVGDGARAAPRNPAAHADGQQEEDEEDEEEDDNDEEDGDNEPEEPAAYVPSGVTLRPDDDVEELVAELKLAGKRMG